MKDVIKNDIKINRPVYDIDDVNEITNYTEIPFELPKCPEKNERLDRFLSYMTVVLPPIEWLVNYDCKRNLFNDIVSGITQFMFHVFQGMAFGLLAGYPAINGIYTSFFPVLVYVIFGSSRHNSIGSTAVIAILTNSAIHNHKEIICDEDDDSFCEDGRYTKVQIGTVIMFYVGIIQMIMWVFRLGILTTVLSSAFISAFQSAAAWHTVSSNLYGLFGIRNERTTGLFKFTLSNYDLLRKLPTTHVPTLVVSLVCLGVLILNNEYLQGWWNKRVKRIPLPTETILLLIGDAISYLANFGMKYRIKLVGYIPTGLPKPVVPNLFLFSEVISDTLSIVIISYIATIAVSIWCAKQRNTFVDVNQELLGLGLSNVVGSFFGCYPVCTSLSRTVLTVKLGGMTQLAALISSVLLFFLILWIGPLFEYLPRAILSCVIIAAFRNVLIEIRHLPQHWKLCKSDFFVWIVTFSSVIVLKVDLGLYIGIGFSLFIIMVSTFSPRVTLLGSLPNSEIYLQQKGYKVDDIDNICILGYKGELTFSMKQLFLNQVKTTLNFDVGEYLIKQSRRKQETQQDNLKFNVLILDLNGVTHLDSTGSECLTEMHSDYKKVGVEVLIAGLTGVNYDVFHRYRNVLKISNNLLLFPTTHDAVVYAKDNLINKPNIN